MGIIYCLTSPSGKKYIGQTTRDFEKRFEEHCTRKECRILYNAIQKYGQYNFKKEILLECNNCFLDKYEIKFINLYDTLYPNVEAQIRIPAPSRIPTIISNFQNLNNISI